MAQFYIPGYAEHDEAVDSEHSPLRQQTALELSVKKLYAIKQAQRTSHRQANLLKTVLVYNMFKAAVSPAAPETAGGIATIASEPQQQSPSSSSSSSMDVDIEEKNSTLDMCVPETTVAAEEADAAAAAAAAEQSWFDRCIDKMLDEDDLEMDYDQELAASDSDSDSDESDSDEDDVRDSHGGLSFGRNEDAPVVRIFDPAVSSDPQECNDGFPGLKRCPSAASIHSYINSCQTSAAPDAGAQIDHVAIAENTTCQEKNTYFCSPFFTT